MGSVTLPWTPSYCGSNVSSDVQIKYTSISPVFRQAAGVRTRGAAPQPGHGPAGGPRTRLLSAGQYSTEQYSTVQYSTVQYSTVQCSTVQ